MTNYCTRIIPPFNATRASYLTVYSMHIQNARENYTVTGSFLWDRDVIRHTHVTPMQTFTHTLKSQYRQRKYTTHSHLFKYLLFHTRIHSHSPTFVLFPSPPFPPLELHSLTHLYTSLFLTHYYQSTST